ncbi:phosphatase PAP2 family protein [Thermomonospora catenispora]|nr:phosphatase PAP2 family protein [Thermomonospora catenispora]
MARTIATASEADAPRSGRGPVRAAARIGAHVSGRPRWWAEAALIAICYLAYSMVRNLVPADHAAAVSRAHEILKIEQMLRLDVEYELNRLFVDHVWLGVTANYYYATLHFAVTIGVLVWLYAWHPGRYVAYRWVLFGTTLTALIGFYSYPLAPPRMLPGYVDTVIEFNTWGLYDSSPVAAISNQYAAMPSLHTAWSLWCGIAIFTVAERRWVRALALAYPTVTVLVIMGTANHFILDAVGGAAVLAIGYAVSPGTLRTMAVVFQMRRSTA